MQSQKPPSEEAEDKHENTSEAASGGAEQVHSGSYVILDYTIQIKETNEVIETTSEEKAKEADVFDPGKVYEPKLVIAGKGRLLKAIEDELTGMRQDMTKTIEIPSDKAFGQRDPRKVRTLPIRKFRSSDVNPVVGARVNIDGKEGIVRSAGSGRVQVDFNPYLAGKSLRCECKVVKVVVDDLEKIKALLHDKMVDVDIGKFGFELQKPVLKITMPPEAFLLPGLQVSKRIIAKDIQETIQDISDVQYLEIYSKASAD